MHNTTANEISGGSTSVTEEKRITPSGRSAKRGTPVFTQQPERPRYSFAKRILQALTRLFQWRHPKREVVEPAKAIPCVLPVPVSQSVATPSQNRVDTMPENRNNDAIRKVALQQFREMDVSQHTVH